MGEGEGGVGEGSGVDEEVWACARMYETNTTVR